MAEVVLKITTTGDASGAAAIGKELARLGPQLEAVANKAKEAADKAEAALAAIQAPGTQAATSLKKAADAADEAGKKAAAGKGPWDGLLGTFAKVGLAAGGIGAIVGAAKGAADSIGDLTSKAEEVADAQARVDLVFGDSAKSIDTWASGAATAFGYSKQAALDAAGGVGQFLTNLGVGPQVAGSMSSGMVDLAAKMAAFNGTTKEQALDALQKGVGGATKGLKEFGVTVTDLPKGLDGAAKAQAIYAQVMKQTENAQKAWADNSGDVDVSMQRVSAAVDNAKAALGDKLLPLIAPLAEKFADALPGAIDAASGALTALGPVFDGLGKIIEVGAQLIAQVIKTLVDAWTNDWGGIRTTVTNVINAVSGIMAKLGPIVDDVWNNKVKPAIATFVDWWSNNVAPTISAVVNAIIGIFENIAGFIKNNWGAIQGYISGAIQVIQGVIQVGFSIVSGIVTAAMALLRGDFSGAWDAIKGAVKGAIDGVVKIVGGLVGMIANQAKLVLAAAASIGRNIADGIKNALQGAWDGLVAKLRGLIDMLPQVVKDLLGIHSPSKVFEEIGKFIVMGLAAGLAKYDVKAVEAMQKVVQSVASAAGAIPGFLKSLKDMVVPTDADLADMEAKFSKVLDIMERFVKSMALRSVAIGVGDSSQIPDEIRKDILAAKLDPGQLISGGDVGNVGGMMDILSKVAGGWKAIADSLTSIASIKVPDVSQLEAVKAAAWALVQFGESVANDMPAVPEFGAIAELLSDAVKGVQSVVGLDLSGFKPIDVGALHGMLSQVEGAMKELALMAQNLTGRMAIDEAGRKAIEMAAANAKSYFDTISSIASSVGNVASLGADLSQVKAVSFDLLPSLEAATAQLALVAFRLTKDILGLPAQAIKDAYSNVKEYFGAVQAIASALKDAASLGKDVAGATAVIADDIDIAGDNAAEAMLKGKALAAEFIGLKDQGAAVADAVKNWLSTAGESAKMLADVAGLGEKTKGAALALYDDLVNAADNAANALQVVRLWTSDWEALADQGEAAAKGIKNWVDGAGAAVELLLKSATLGAQMENATRATPIRLGIVRSNIASAVGALKQLIDDLMAKGQTTDTITFMTGWVDGLGKIVDLFAKAGGLTVDWSAVARIPSEVLPLIRQNVADIADQMRGLQADLEGKGFTADLLAAIGTWSGAVSGVVSGFASSVKGLGDLAGAKGVTVSADVVKAAIGNIRTIIEAFQNSGITAEAATAARTIAEAVKPASEALSGALAPLEAFLASPFFSAGRRVRMAKTSSQYGVLSDAGKFAERLKLAIQTAVQTVLEALASVKIPANLDTKVLDPLIALIDRYAEAIGKINDIKIDSANIAAFVSAAQKIAAGLMPLVAGDGGSGAAGTGGSGGKAPAPHSAGGGGGGILSSIGTQVNNAAVYYGTVYNNYVTGGSKLIIDQLGAAGY